MADLPSSETSLEEQSSGVALGTDTLVVLSCMQRGLDLSSDGVLKPYAKVSDIEDDAGSGEGLEFAGHYIPVTRKTILFGILKTVVAAAIGNVDTTGVLGTSVVTFTGTPLDDEE